MKNKAIIIVLAASLSSIWGASTEEALQRLYQGRIRNPDLAAVTEDNREEVLAILRTGLSQPIMVDGSSVNDSQRAAILLLKLGDKSTIDLLYGIYSTDENKRRRDTIYDYFQIADQPLLIEKLVQDLDSEEDPLPKVDGKEVIPPTPEHHIPNDWFGGD